MEDLIAHYNALFDDRSTFITSPPLPSTPTGEQPQSYGYGSSFTQVANVISQNEKAASNDFSPRLPSHPSNSIHPSRRTNTSVSPDDDNSDESNSLDLQERISIQSSSQSSQLPQTEMTASESTVVDE